MNINKINGRIKYVGSEFFMSPLLYNGLKHNNYLIAHNTFKSDVFSLGLCFLYAMALDLNVIKIIREKKCRPDIEKRIKDKFVNLPKYPKRLWNIVFKMIEYEEENRYDFIELEKHLPFV